MSRFKRTWGRTSTMVLSLGFILSGCGETPLFIPDPAPVMGTNFNRSCASTTNTTTAPASSDLAPQLTELQAVAGSQVSDAEFTAERIIVGYRQAKRIAQFQTLSLRGVTLTPAGSAGLEGTQVYQLNTTSELKAREVMEALRQQPDVEYVEFDARVYLQQSMPAGLPPTDSRYGEQWDMETICMRQAWNINTGNSATVVAVLDTGILYDMKDPARRHPDLAGKVLQGFDFIRETNCLTSGDKPEPQPCSLDGDGWDANPYDPGGDIDVGISSYHGTHVAGIIAAASNNRLGVAGVNWEARILPVRVLGRNGGWVSDMSSAILWAAGVPVNDAPPGQTKPPVNITPAKVINLSVGGSAKEGDSKCPEVLQKAITRAVSMGVVIVTAAGNGNTESSRIFPANCRNVITVGATGKTGKARASYSNYGKEVDLMAPGGDASNGVLNVWGPDGSYGYRAIAGTSMAAPHVTGVVALLKELRPNLTPAEIETKLRITSTPLTAQECRTEEVNGCGAGLIDAGRALQ